MEKTLVFIDAGFLSKLSKQKRSFEGQKEFFRELEFSTLIEMRITPLKQHDGEVHQKGVDVLLATDLISLAHAEAYDLAIILSGDTDLIEAVKLIKTLGKIPVIFSYYDQKRPEHSNIYNLRGSGKFVNLKDLTNEEIFSISELREKKD